MRICLVAHGFPPYDRTGVENYTESLAKALSRIGGHEVTVFAPRKASLLPEFSLRRVEQRGPDGRFDVHWLTVNAGPKNPREQLDLPQAAASFADFLEREQPEVVHFQHVFKLGTGLIHEAKKRGIPTLYTAHDYYAVCHRYTLLRPDLAHCEIRGDSASCSRCDLALGHLNAIPELGDYQMGAFEDQLSPEQDERLAGILDEDLARSGMSQEEFDQAFDRRFELDALRARAFDALDRIIAPTEFLAGELVAGGVDRAKIEVLPYGVETGDLVDLPPVRRDPEAPVRFGFFGSLAKHKGVHRLVDAFRGLDLPCELSIYGYSTDRPNVERLRISSLDAKAVWAGEYDRPELPRLLAGIDVVVVPSIWVENYPIVIREAFAAKRPVIAYRFGALPESIEDGVDGLLAAKDDAADLARVMARCVQEPGLIERLAGGIRRVKTIDEQAAELLERYASLLAEFERERGTTGLASLSEFEARYRKLAAEPSRELFHRALSGIDRLRRGFGGQVGELDVKELFAKALLSNPKVQILLRDANLENSWMQNTLQVKEDELDWRVREMGALVEERDWLRSVVADKDDEIAWMREKVASFVRARQELEKTTLRLEQALAQAERSLVESESRTERLSGELEQTTERLQDKAGELTRTKDELSSTEGVLQEVEGELTDAKDDVRAKELETRRIEGNLKSTAELGLLALRAQEQLLKAELLPLFGGVREAQEGSATDEEARAFMDLVESAKRSRHRMFEVSSELDWRREQMRSAYEEARGRKLAGFIIKHTGVGRRLDRWKSWLDWSTRPREDGGGDE